MPHPRPFFEMTRKDADGCEVWTGARHRQGYGLRTLEGRVQLAHRVAWKFRYGSLADDVKVLHSCDNPPCVNWRHLFLGTQADNVADMIAKGRGNRGERHGNAKLDDATVLTIRARATAGESQSAIARDVGVKPCTVNQIVHRHLWRHI